MEPTRILFVTWGFHQGGSERYLYEVLKVLDPGRFRPEVLVLGRPDPDAFYYPRLRALGIPIWQWPSLSDPQNHRRPTLRARLLWRLGMTPENPGVDIRAWRDFLSRFRLLYMVQIEAYLHLQPWLEAATRCVIHLMSVGIQYFHDPYARCGPGRSYRFILAAPVQEADLTASAIQDRRVYHLPLCMDLADRPLLFSAQARRQPTKIGLFTRLSVEKPIDPFFYALRTLRAAQPVELHVFGGGDPGPFQRAAAVAHCAADVSFRGHAPDLLSTLKEEGFSLIWHTCYDEGIQYAGIELGSVGMPILFWNLSRGSHEAVLQATQGAVHAFQDVDRLARFSLEILSDPDHLERLGTNLRSYILRHCDIRSRISDLHAILDDVAAATPSLP